jgi:hypothetical protein
MRRLLWQSRWKTRVCMCGGFRWQKFWTEFKKQLHMYINGKMRPLKTIPWMQERGGQGEWWKWWIQLSHIVRNFVNVTMYPSTTIINVKYKNKK